jgi:aminopeptidase N
VILNNHTIEEQLWQETTTHTITSLRRKLLTTLASATTSPAVIESIYNLWKANGATWLSTDNTFTSLNESDAISITYELGIRLPELQPEIIATQRARITNPDRVREFDFIARGTSSSVAERDALFNLLLDPAERRTEPWAATLLKLLNHHTRQVEALKYIP